MRSGGEARRQLRTATARRLALQGGTAERIDRRPDLALLLALESLRLEPSREASRTLLDVFAAGSLRDGFSVWDVSTGRRRDVPDAGEVFGIALDGDGRMATAGRGSIQLWRTDELTRVGSGFPAHPGGGPVALVFDSDRRRLVSSGGDALVNLWDPEAIPEGPLAFFELERAAYAVSFSRDGTQLLLGDGARTVSLVEIDPARWAERACAIVNRDLTPAEWQTYLAPAPFRRTCERESQ